MTEEAKCRIWLRVRPRELNVQMVEGIHPREPKILIYLHMCIQVVDSGSLHELFDLICLNHELGSNEYIDWWLCMMYKYEHVSYK